MVESGKLTRQQRTKYIFITGGVVSSLGKGIAAASIGLLLKSRGCRIQFQKLDPYLNVDPGTMNPYQHGEVYITADGAETDLDLGHYERFTGIETTRNSNFTAGRIYMKVIQEERLGSTLGETIQVVPHITNEIKNCILKLDTPEVDIAIVEIGGTVGDIESLPFLEALRQFNLERESGDILFIHLTLVPFIKAAGELKTKPTQHSVARLREIGIQPQVLLCRSEQEIDADLKRKLSLFCSVRREAVIEARDVRDVYEVPLLLAKEGLDELILKHFGLQLKKPAMEDWQKMLDKVRRAATPLTIAVVGKYIGLQDAYKSIYEALNHAAVDAGVALTVLRVSSENLAEVRKLPTKISGILVPGGFGTRGIDGKVLAARLCREKKIPFFGICLGMQLAAVEFAQNACKLESANSLEMDPSTPHAVIALMDSQKNIRAKGGTMRLGNYPCHLVADSKAAKAYGRDVVLERHRHRFEFNNEYREAFERQGMTFSGLSPDKHLVELMELASHPWFVGCQFHPEFRSSVLSPHPLFKGFIGAALAYNRLPHG